MTKFKALIQLGLDITNGISNLIRTKDIEQLCKCRVVGNGSTIRRDKEPYLFFNYEAVKERNSIVGFKFLGYKTVRDVIGELKHQIESSKNRIALEERKINEREKLIQNIKNSKSLNDKYYSKKNVEKYL